MPSAHIFIVILTAVNPATKMSIPAYLAARLF